MVGNSGSRGAIWSDCNINMLSNRNGVLGCFQTLDGWKWPFAGTWQTISAWSVFGNAVTLQTMHVAIEVAEKCGKLSLKSKSKANVTIPPNCKINLAINYFLFHLFPPIHFLDKLLWTEDVKKWCYDAPVKQFWSVLIMILNPTSKTLQIGPRTSCSQVGRESSIRVE